MIEFTKSYKTSDGQVFGSLEDAQVHDLALLIDDGATAELVAKEILKQKDTVIDILTTTPNSKPKARATHGGTKKRGTKTVITNAPAGDAASAFNKVLGS